MLKRRGSQDSLHVSRSCPQAPSHSLCAYTIPTGAAVTARPRLNTGSRLCNFAGLYHTIGILAIRTGITLPLSLFLSLSLPVFAILQFDVIEDGDLPPKLCNVLATSNQSSTLARPSVPVGSTGLHLPSLACSAEPAAPPDQ